MSLPHLFEQCGCYFLFFPRSARLYEVSGAAASLVSEVCGTEVLDPSSAPLTFPPALADDEVSLHDELRGLLQHEQQVPLPLSSPGGQSDGLNSFHTFSLYLAHTCNMSCCYCWNLGGSFGKRGHLMAGADATAITDLISTLLAGSRAQDISVNFYGGEPLLNFDVLRQITLDLLQRQDRLEKTFHFSLDTNGSLLEGENAQFLARHFAQVAVSLDGREEIHDIQRPGKRGETTWRRIVKNIRDFPNREILGLRATLTRLSDSYGETFRQLSSLGVRRIQLEYCHQPGYHHNPSYDKLMVPLERQLQELREFLTGYVNTISRYRDSRDIPYLSNLLEEIIRLRRGNRSSKPCGAGINTVAINSRGEIFPCIAFVNHEAFRMESDGGGSSLSLMRPLQEFEVDNQAPCQGCWLRYHCAGGCYTTHFDASGNARPPHPDYCAGMRRKAEVYLYAMAQMQEKCPWHLEL